MRLDNKMLINYIIVCPLVFLAGFIDAIAGGGGLISLPAYIMTGIPIHYAVGTNKISSSLGTIVSTVEFARNGYLRIKLAAPSIITAFVGSFIGAKIALEISSYFFKILLLVIIPATALYLIFNRQALHHKSMGTDDLSTYQIVWTMVVALLLGVYDGFYGPGTGTFLLILLTGIAHLPINLAVGNTKIINLTTNITALVVFLNSGKVLLLLGLIAGIFSIAGNHFGVLYYKKYGSQIARPIIIIVLLIFMVKTIYDFF